MVKLQHNRALFGKILGVDRGHAKKIGEDD